MTWTAPDVEPDRPPYAVDERTMLDGWLDHHRQTLLHKCAGLAAEQLRLRSAEPSSLSLLGLVRHMAGVERWWFRQQFDGKELPWLYGTGDDEFDLVDDADPEADFATFAAEVEAARATAAGRGLDETFRNERRAADLNLRWVYVHMIEEYARHNGHADLIRERIDGVVET